MTRKQVVVVGVVFVVVVVVVGAAIALTRPAGRDDDAADLASASPAPAGSACIEQNSESAPDFLGLTLPEGQRLASRRSEALRVVGRDGVCLSVAEDLRASRVNVVVAEGVITAARLY